jgi:hypothetical protein
MAPQWQLEKYGVRSDGIVEDADVVSGTLGTTYCTPSIFKLSYFNFSLLTSIFWSMRTYSLNRNHENELPYHVLNPTHIDSHKLATKMPVGLNDTTATKGTEFMCNALGSENIGLQAIVAQMKEIQSDIREAPNEFRLDSFRGPSLDEND